MKAGLVRQLSLSDIIPAPINSNIYRQPGADDGLEELVESIKKRGIMTPLTVSEDLHIISGHRRREAAIRAQVAKIPCIVREGIFYPSKEFSELLVEANTQREKTLKEIAAEHVVLKSGEQAAAALIQAKTMPEVNGGVIGRFKKQINTDLKRKFGQRESLLPEELVKVHNYIKGFIEAMKN